MRNCTKCSRAVDRDDKYCKSCGSELGAPPETDCNLCGLTCAIGENDFRSDHGLLNIYVSGGYASTPGNGHGALDDMTDYNFSLCEFCLDWLFSRFKIPVKVSEYGIGSDEDGLYAVHGKNREEWRSAKQRIEEDEWRKYKRESLDEIERRAAARKVPAV
jgi:hypothetical protein